MIDEVYRVVQVVLNKNDRGVITPDRFNDLATAVQLKIFSEIPNDIRLAVNRKNAGRGGSSIDRLKSALNLLLKSEEIVRDRTTPYYFKLPADLSEITSVYDLNREIERISFDKLRRMSGISLMSPTRRFPVYAIAGDGIEVLPKEILSVTVNYRRKVNVPKWTYMQLGGRAVFNPADSTYCDFELDEYFFNRIVVDMLEFAGLHLREQEVVQVAQQAGSTDFNKENAV